MKTPEELASLRREVEALNTKLAELTEDELAQVAGGLGPGRAVIAGYCNLGSLNPCRLRPDKRTYPQCPKCPKVND